MGTIFFYTNRQGAKRINDADGLIGVFADSKNDVVETDEGLKKNSKIENVWFLPLDEEKDADKIVRIRKLKTYGSQIKETRNEISVAQLNNLRHTNDPGKFNPDAMNTNISAEVDKKVDEKVNQLKKDMQRYGQLFAEVCKAGGKYLIDADPEKIKEFETLKLKLGIEEEKIEEPENEKITQ